MRRSKALLLAVLLALSACAEKKAPTAAPTPSMLVIAQPQEVISMDPQTHNDAITWSVLGNIYEPLVEFDNNMAIVGRLTERWENPNDLTWRFYLRKGVQFHNGKPFTADDVLYTIRRGMSHTGIRPYLISVKEAKRVSDYVVDIITERPHPVLLNRLTFVFILPDGESPDSEITHPVGTGPFRFERMVSQDEVYLLANDQYWKGKPDASRVKFVHYVTDEEMVDRLVSGEIHLAKDFAERLSGRVEDSPLCNLITQDGLGVTLLGFNLAPGNPDNPFLKPEVRQAVYHAINAQELVEKTARGQARFAPQLVSPNVFGFDPKYMAPPRDLKSAKDLLAEAGYPSGLSTILYGTEKERMEMVRDQVARAGIRFDVKVIPWKDLYEGLIQKKVSVFTFSWNCSTGDASDFLDSCVHSENPAAGYGNFNPASYRDPQVDAWIEQSSQTLRIADRKQLLQKALGKTQTDLPYIPLFSRFRLYGVSSAVKWTPRGDGRMYAFDVRWKRENE